MEDLVLLPGLLCDAALWEDVMPGLADVARCRVADISREESMAALADAVLAAAPPRFALAGFSLGGYVAQAVLRQAPERVTRLALLDTNIHADTPSRQADRQALIAAARRPGRFAGITDRMLATFVHPDRLHDAALVDRIKAMTQRMGRDVFIRQSLLDRPDGAAALRGFAGPVLILCGRQDALTPLALHEEMAALARRATLTVVETCGHMAPMERPAEVAAALRAWLAA